MASWGPRQGGAGPRLCFRCNQPGHFIAQCPYELQAQAHANIARPLSPPSNGCDSGFKSDGFGLGDSEVWVADSGAAYHVTGDPTFMFECNPPSAGKGTLLVGDMRLMHVECFGKLSMVMHSAGGDLDVVLMNVAYVPGFKFHLFSLHEVMPKC
ncbi:unnamed protein product, partial [Laminaria digitata]